MSWAGPQQTTVGEAALVPGAKSLHQGLTERVNTQRLTVRPVGNGILGTRVWFCGHPACSKDNVYNV